MRNRLHELWQYRDLIRNLVTRDVKVRYRNSLLGIAWSWINPLLMMAVYTVVFTVLTGDQDGTPNYPVFILSALLPWNFCATAIAQTTNCILDGAHMIKKAYFPREILPMTAVASNLINLLLSLPVFFLLAVAMGNPISAWVLLLPIVILIQTAFVLGLGMLTATLNVFYRDTQIIMNVLLLAWFFLTPVFYSINHVPETYTVWGMDLAVRRYLQWVNPMASIIAAYRDLLYYGAPTGWDFLLRTAVTSFAVLMGGYAVFQRYSWRFSEEV
ncbi:MAG: ABC transporter permease [Anaerolineae bacterium]|nr:ABC transporter permease [Anaerolineae bacterium]